ncbi:putative metal-dependent enzyme (double-stranded beta helix superfamily) [Paraburkholderia sp. WC7.3g]|uniref:cysteine dioxygenase family protein n=1 Tax=Paraburkholderia sp. WC7.3g TaxID=2991070 RepID=UPI003D22BD44
MSDDLRATAFEHLPDYLKSRPAPARPEAAALPPHTLGEIGRTPLERLCDTLDAMFESCAKFPEPSHSTFFARIMRLALAEAAADPSLLAPMQREGAAGSYRRHLLVADPQGRYAIAALVWQPGQASPVHAHHTWCGYAVVEGKLSETIFEWDNVRQCASTLRALARKHGAVSFVRSGRAAIHRLGNCSDAPAVSLHIYGVEGARIGTHVNDIVRVTDAAELV